MNIFKVLSSNDGSINEPNVSSFLAYLLDPNENHGLGSKLVERFLEPIVMSSPQFYKELIYEGRIRDLSSQSFFEVRVQAELTVISYEDRFKKKTRDIDIVIELFNRQSADKVPLFAFCIENKIKDGAIVKGGKQLFEEAAGFQNYYTSEGAQAPLPSLSFIYLTPPKKQGCRLRI
ncbi:PD-(D/E)XK nuclease family protein [Domibacillus indicus]|uniref:PD-(D/E)XK nuclease family protein n=1 Tax=Domibacillus indicus TaxID=1437523 RepID=UPI0006180A32|nr:PD-(D/E)XK nuclease family protein [Domibacillus indicus]